MLAPLLFFGREGASEKRIHAENRKQLRRDIGRLKTRRLLARKGQIEIVIGIGGHPRKNVIAVAPFAKVWSGRAAKGHALRNHRAPNENELAGIFVGKRLQ